MECHSPTNCTLCQDEYYIYGPQKVCVKCDGPNERVNKIICEEIINNCEDINNQECIKCKEGFFMNKAKNECEEIVYLNLVLEQTSWKHIFFLNFRKNCSSFLQSLQSSASTSISYFLNKEMLNDPKTTLSLQDEKGILLGIEIQKSYPRDSKFTIKINSADWMVSNTNAILNIFEFSISLPEDFRFCGNNKYFDESK